MNRRVLAVVGVALLVATGWGVRALGDPRAREARRVEKRVTALAEAVSFSEKDNPFLRLGYAERVAGFFGSVTDLAITLGSREAHASLTHQELKDRAVALRAAARGLSVQFLDLDVNLNPGLDEATVHLTSKIYFTGEPDYSIQEFRLRLTRPPDQPSWQVRGIETVRTME
ncbi:MAG: hypothetical protein AB7O66_19975 [Limisphaerales bacterium]